MTGAVPSAHSPAARLVARAFALALDPELSAEAAVTRLLDVARGSAPALEAALRRSRWRQLERPSITADAAAYLLQSALGRLGAGEDEDESLVRPLEHVLVRP